MEQTNREERRRLFRYELFTLKQEGYLSEEIVRIVANAHQQYHLDLIAEASVVEIDESKEKIHKEEPAKAHKPIKVKKVLTKEQVRERNITWSLNIGVIFLLISGLFVATSNWQTMTSFMKSVSIGVVMLLFYGLSILSEKVLKIQKTSLAFLVLGSLFLPIFILSLGWFGLLGKYFSVSGGGRYLLGVIGSMITLIVYGFTAKKLNSRLFVWFTYIAFSSGIAFLLASFKLKLDFFYLGLMIGNAVLIMIFQYIKKNDALQLFVKEFVLFIQANLVLSTLFMLVFYNNELLYSFNVLLTAVIYLSMIYVSERREYHFIFTIMLVYGAYQLIEHSFLNDLGEIVYALIGFGLVFVPKVLKEEFSLDKVFQYTSAIISGFAFIYISLEGILLRSGKPSIVLMLAYCIIAINYLYLSSQNGRKIFPYLCTVFTVSFIYEAVSFAIQPIHFIDQSTGFFISGFMLFLLIGISGTSKYIKVIKIPSIDVGLGVMLLALCWGISLSLWSELGVMLLLFMIVAYSLKENGTRKIYQKLSLYLIPSSLGLALLSFGEEWTVKIPSYFEHFGYGVNFAITAMIVWLTSYVWRRNGEHDLERITHYTSQVLYTLTIVFAILGPIDLLWVQPVILIIGIANYYHFYKIVETKWSPFLVSLTIVLSYYSIMQSINSRFTFGEMTNSMMITSSSVLLLVLAFLYKKSDTVLSNAFAWIGHILYPMVLVFSWIVFHTDSIISLVIAIITYAMSSRVVIVEWKTKLFLYGTFSSLFVSVSTAIDAYPTQSLQGYEFPITSLLIFLFSYIAPEVYKKRTMYYFIPFSCLGIGLMLSVYPFSYVAYLITCVYSLGVIVYLHKTKKDLLVLLPLFLSFAATVEFCYQEGFTPLHAFLLAGGWGIALNFIGQVVYKKLIEENKKFWDIKVDAYTFVSLLFFWFMYFFVEEIIWMAAIPGIFIASTIWLQKKRVPETLSVFMPIIGGLYLLEPYYSVLERVAIPPLWQREIQILPFIVLVVFIQFMLKGRYGKIMKSIQWAVLVVTALVLIQDGLASNTIYDAIIIGSLSLVSMLTGIVWKIKSYFFVGAGVLLLNVFLQTRPWWGNAPWWVYLLVSGFILITVASLNEWHKQKTLKGESTFITFIQVKIIKKIKQWS